MKTSKFLLLSILVLSLSACGSKKPEAKTEAPKIEATAPETAESTEEAIEEVSAPVEHVSEDFWNDNNYRYVNFLDHYSEGNTKFDLIGIMKDLGFEHRTERSVSSTDTVFDTTLDKSSTQWLAFFNQDKGLEIWFDFWIDPNYGATEEQTTSDSWCVDALTIKYNSHTHQILTVEKGNEAISITDCNHIVPPDRSNIEFFVKHVMRALNNIDYGRDIDTGSHDVPHYN